MKRAAAKAQSRAEILAEARRQFARFGFDQVTIRNVAQALGRSTGMVMCHFPTKEGLYRAAMGVAHNAADAFVARLAIMAVQPNAPGQLGGLILEAQRIVEARTGSGAGEVAALADRLHDQAEAS